jgi:hypothetical protein
MECEKYTALQFAHTIIRADKGISVPVHAGAIVRAQKDQIEAIQVDTGDVTTIIASQKDILEQIEALTGLGGMRTSKNQVASGTAIIEERKQLHRAAKSKARLMEVTEEMIFTYAARFMNVRWAGEVSYNTDYEAHDTNYRLALIQQAQTMAGDSPIVKALITREIIAMLAPATEIPEYEQAYIATVPDAAVKQLMTDDADAVNSRDLGASMIPDQVSLADSIQEAKDSQSEHNNNASLLGGVGTPVTNIGITYYPNQVAPALLNTMSIGR